MRADDREVASIRPATFSDAPALSQVYAEALPGDVCARLGLRYLANTFFPALLRSPETHAVLAERGDAILGFCVMATDSSAVNSMLKRMPIAAARAAAMSALRDGRLLYDIYCSLFRVRLALDPGVTIERIPEVYLIGVRPAAQGHSIGRRLLAEGLATIAGVMTGGTACVAKTSALGAVEFYRRQGFSRVGMEWRGPRGFHVMLQRTTVAPAPRSGS